MRLIFVLAILCLSYGICVQNAKANILDIQEITTQSGIKAWLVEDHSVPVIALSFSFLGAGSTQDSEDKQGLTRLASNTMDEGAGQMDATAFQERLKELSTTLYFQSSRDHFGGELKTLTKNKNDAFALLRSALNNPRFDQEAIDRMRQANQSRIRSALSDPKWLAARIMNDRLYNAHSYALNSGGTISSLNNISRDDLVEFVKNRLAQDNLRIAVVGDITADDLRKAIDNIFTDLPENANLKPIDAVASISSGEVYLFKKEVPQTIFEMSYKGLKRGHPDYIAFQVVNYILGSSGFGSRLMDDIREKRGLTYGIYSQLLSLDYAQNLTISSSTKNESAMEMLSLIKANIESLKNDGATEDELINAQSYLIGSLPLSLTSTDKIARILISLMQDDLPVDYLQHRNDTIKALTIADINKVAQTYLNPENYVAVLVGSPTLNKDDETLNIKIVESIPNAE